jgi:chromosome partitioning protein
MLQNTIAESSPARAAGHDMIVGVINQKGGVGKTTLATHIAGEWGRLGHRVVVVDADPQESAFDWSRMRIQTGLPKLFDVISLARETLHPEYATTNDHVIIDGPSRNTALARSTVLASDLILIPVQPSSYDVWGSGPIVSLICEARAHKPNLKAAFVINRCIVGTTIGRDIHGALTGEIPILQTVITQRVVFAESVATGRLVRELDDSSAAARSIAALADEVMGRAL